ncbi:MAG: hypothetical protein IJY79_03415 [Clostridia bacterium]|nr:hypothetical protein [Clostridia bacterium]
MLERFPYGARVCFIGDSLTAQNTVQWMTVDCYKRNFPDSNIEFINCGVAGGAAWAALQYLEDDVFIHNPTHAVIGFGVNDSSRWDLSRPRSFERYDRMVSAFERFKKCMRELCDILIARGIKVTLCTPPPYDEFHESSEPAFVGGYALILAYADEVRKIAEEKNLPVCDYFTFFAREMQMDTLYCGDHVHPNHHGYYTMAKYFLAQQGLELGEEKATPPEYLREWCKKVGEKVEIYGGELMIVQNYTASLEDKIKKVEYYLEHCENEIPRKIEIANNYLRLKPQQEQILKDIKELYIKNVFNK